MNIVGLDTLTSRSTTRPAHTRIDPYWAGLWNVSSTASWATRASVERLVEQGLVKRPPAWIGTSTEQVLEKIALGNRSRWMLPSVAAIGCFRTVTADQLAAITGYSKQGPWAIEMLLASEIASVGSVVPPSGVKVDYPPLLRPGFQSDLSGLMPLLSHAQQVGVTHGQPWRTGTAADRHNVLATELLLRIAEYTDVPLVVGEQLTELSQLTGRQGTQKAGDGGFVRADGSMVVVEVTASTSRNFADKVERWVEALVANRDLAVVWVDISHPDSVRRGRAKETKTIRPIRKAIQRAMNTPSAIAAGVNKRIMVATYADWFPSAHTVDLDEFIPLRALRPTGRGESTWEVVDMLDPFDLVLGPTGSGLVTNSNLLYGVPHWQQTGKATL